MSSDIEWTDETWNPVVGCTPVSPGCLNCYAATMAPRLAAMGQEVYVGLTVKRGGFKVVENGENHGGEPGSLAITDHAKRYVFNGTVRTLPDRLTDPLGWKKPRQVFVNSMSDLFHESVPFEFIDRVFALMALTPRHTYQILTKRPERMAEYMNTVDRFEQNVYERAMDMAPWHISDRADYCEEYVQTWPLPNVWLGTSVEDQKRADERIPWLLKTPAAVRFLSCEPLLGSIDLRKAMPIALFHCSECGNEKRSPDCAKCGTQDNEASNAIRGIDWVIVGGESGAKSKIRWCNVEWIREIVTQCKAAKVPVFVKQMGTNPIAKYTEATGAIIRPQLQPAFLPLKLKSRKGNDMKEWSKDLRVREMPKVVS